MEKYKEIKRMLSGFQEIIYISKKKLNNNNNNNLMARYSIDKIKGMKEREREREREQGRDSIMMIRG